MNVRHFDTPAAARSSGLYLRGLARGELRAMGETSPTYDEKGAELVPAELYGTIINQMSRQSVALRVAFVVQTISNRITLPKLGNATAAFYAEAAEGTLTDIATEGVTVNLFGMRSLSAISNDLIEDSVVDVASIFSGACANAFSTGIDHAWLQGNVTAGIDGLVGEVTNDVLVGCAAGVTPEKLAEMVGQIDPLAANTAWVVSPAGYGAILELTVPTAEDVVVTYWAGVAPGDPIEPGLRSCLLLLVGHLYANREATTADGIGELPMGLEMLLAAESVLGTY